MQSISDYIDKHQNNHSKVAIVWGSGTSANNLHPDRYSPFLNIAVNASIMLFPSWYGGSDKNRISISLDVEAVKWSWFPTDDIKCHRFLRKNNQLLDADDKPTRVGSKLTFPPEMYKAKNTYCFDRRQRKDLVAFNKIDSCPAINTAPLSIDLAVKTGAKLIALAGMEQVANKDDVTHFYQTWPEEEQPVFDGKIPRGSPYVLPTKRQVRRWRRNVNVISMFQAEAAKRGIKIVRLSEQSALGFIPYMDEDSFISLAERTDS